MQTKFALEYNNGDIIVSEDSQDLSFIIYDAEDDCTIEVEVPKNKKYYGLTVTTKDYHGNVTNLMFDKKMAVDFFSEILFQLKLLGIEA